MTILVRINVVLTIVLFSCIIYLSINNENNEKISNNLKKNIKVSSEVSSEVSSKLPSKLTSDNIICSPVTFIPPFRFRDDIGLILKEEGKKIGIELGVQKGIFSTEILRKWQSADLYILVDLWQHQNNYIDGANVATSMHNINKNEAIQNMNDNKEKGFVKEFQLCHNYTNTCVLNFTDEYFDFIYVDARHDYKGVLDDIKNWYPKLKKGGIIAGHDYMIQDEIDKVSHNKDDWTLNYDGTKDETRRIVRGAVDDFFSDKFGDMRGCPRQITISYREDGYNTWAARK